MLAQAWPATVRLVGISLVLSYLIGIAVGVVQAARGGRLDTVLSVATVTLFALPGYWLGLMLVMVFTYRLRLLPAFGAAGFDADFLPPAARLADRLRHLVLPLATLTLVGIGGTARFVRGAMLDVAGAPWVTVARAKGLSETRVTLRHVLRNALVPVVTLLGLSLPTLFSGAVFIEAIFAWPGVGRVLVEAVQARDYPVVMAATAVSAAARRARQPAGRGAGALGRSEGAMRGDARRLLADRRAMAGLAILALAALAALLAPLLAGDPIAQREIVATRFLPPFDHRPAGRLPPARHRPAGARRVGAPGLRRARLARRRHARGAAVGGASAWRSGAAAGFWRGWLGTALLGLTDFALALPRVVLLLLLASLWRPSAGLVILVLGADGMDADRAAGPRRGARPRGAAVRGERGGARACRGRGSWCGTSCPTPSPR